MPKVKFILFDGSVTEVESAAGLSVMEASKQAAIEEIVAECGGGLSCATCHIYVREAWWDRIPGASADEQDLLEATNEPRPNSRLSCQVILTDELDGLEIDVPASQV